MRYVHNGLKMFLPGIEWNKNSSKELLQFAIGALLFAPANHETAARDICSGRYKEVKSIVFCLEDAILDSNVKDAEHKLIQSIHEIYNCMKSGNVHENDLPLIFVRVRNSHQVEDIFQRMGDSEKIVSGFVLPKVDSSNLPEYKKAICSVNNKTSHKKYVMAAIESLLFMDKKTRKNELQTVKEILDEIKDLVLNIRVGGNDFCSFFGVRRGRNQSVYDICVVNDVLTDIINTFGMEYIISAPVWEYFGKKGDPFWIDGLKKEIELDKLNGFVGKTAIHPVQLSVIQETYAVERNDYEDALSVIHWKSETLGVEKSIFSQRMNEVKIHERWARKILILAKIYGVKE